MLKKFKEKIKNDQKGSGLVNVLGVSLIVSLTAIGISSSAAYTTQYKNTTLSKQQARDNITMGITQLEYLTRLTECKDYMSTISNDLTSQDGKQRYKIRPYRSNSEIQPTSVNDLGTSYGCPGPGDKWLLFEVEGISSKDSSVRSKETIIYKNKDNSLSNTTRTSILGSEINISSSLITKSNGVTTSPYIHSTSRSFICKDSEIQGFFAKSNNTENEVQSDLGNCTYNNVITADTKKIKRDKAKVLNKFSSNIDHGDKPDGIANESNFAIISSPEIPYSPNLANPVINSFKPSITQIANPAVFKAMIESLESPTFIDVTDPDLSKRLETLLNTDTVKEFSIKTDITILSPSFKAKNITVSSANNQNNSLNFVNPAKEDTDGGIKPDSSVSNFVGIKNVHGTSSLLYSAGNININNSDLTGQIHSGSTVNFNNSELKSYPVNLYGLERGSVMERSSLVRVK